MRKVSRIAAYKVINHSKKLLKLSKEVKGGALRLLLRLFEKRGLLRGLKVVRSFREALQAHHLQPHGAAAQLELVSS